MKTKSIISSGYVQSGYYPQKVQSEIVRNYNKRLGLKAHLHIAVMINEFEFLEKVFLEEKEISSMTFFSKQMLSDLSNWENLFKKHIQSNGLQINFALEDDRILNCEDVDRVKLELFQFKNNKNSLINGTNKLVELVTQNHTVTKRDYNSRAQEQKPNCAKVAKQFGVDYWDGDRSFGYGGYKDDGRWRKVAERIIETYNLKSNATILDIGCGKGYLLNELKHTIPSLNIYGIDCSEYAIQNAPADVKKRITLGCASALPFEDGMFDFVFSNMTLHNLKLPKLISALREITRVSRGESWIGVESYVTEEQKWNLMRWQLTCEAFYDPEEWMYIFQLAGYKGDYELVYFD